MPQLINDLAYILIVASLVTIIFKRLRQPLVLGYIVAGFLAGPHMPYTPSVTDMGSIEDWSQIGVIFLMFSLGLEFSFKKIVKMGIRPIIAACSVMLCMIGVGSTVGYILGWGNMDRLFLGGMLAMSSTTIIYKAFEDLGIRSRKFASSVLSVLILEDILGILLMVILSAMAVSRQFEGMQLFNSLLKLGFFLVLWFIVGIYIVPLFLRRYRKYINLETLLIVSVGLCFLLVEIADSVGYSPAFGAFMMGSILAETIEAERIEHAISSLRDLFGAIFFVSVGMMVDPHVITSYWYSILAITIAVILGQMLFGTVSFLFSGQRLKDAMQCGFSLAQIGEFAFIIAAMGQSLGVTSKFLYPVVVSVSIVTTFFTPYMIRLSVPAYELFDSFLPGRMTHAIDKVKDKRNLILSYNNEYTIGQAWKEIVKQTIVQSVAYITLCVAVIGISFASFLPLCRQTFTHWPGNIICGVITFLLVSPCVRPICMRNVHSSTALFIRKSGALHRSMFFGLLLVRFAVGCNVFYYILNFLSPYWWVWHIIASIALMCFVMENKRIKLLSIKLERTFMQNFTSREQHINSKSPSYGNRLKGRDIHIAQITLPLNTAWGGHTLSQLHFGRTEGVHIAAIVRGSVRINIPDGTNKVYPGDVLEIVGDDTCIEKLTQRMSLETINPDSQQLASRLTLMNMKLSKFSPFIGKSIVEIDLRRQYHCMVIGKEDSQGNIHSLRPTIGLEVGDVLWVVGEEADLSLLSMNF